MTQRKGLVDKDIRIVITVHHMFNKPEGRLSVPSRDLEDIKRTQIRPLEMKTTTSEMKVH